MRDIVRDAAIVMIAKQVMEGDTYWSVATFVETYAKGDKDQQELRCTLSLFGLVYQKYEVDRWSNIGTYNWYWTSEEA